MEIYKRVLLIRMSSATENVYEEGAIKMATDNCEIKDFKMGQIAVATDIVGGAIEDAYNIMPGVIASANDIDAILNKATPPLPQKRNDEEYIRQMIQYFLLAKKSRIWKPHL